MNYPFFLDVRILCFEVWGQSRCGNVQGKILFVLHRKKNDVIKSSKNRTLVYLPQAASQALNRERGGLGERKKAC